jgi:esterase/lipase superfamily enzyme
MNVEYHKWWSASLGQDMELKTYGHGGKPVLVFPAAGGRFYEYEDFGMVEACRPFVEEGRILLVAVDSVDRQSWLNTGSPPADRARRHNDYDLYIVKEVGPFLHDRGYRRGFLSTGSSMGGYHAANIFFRHPDLFDSVIALSGVYRLRRFIGDYMDDNVYFNTPLAYLPNLVDPWYLDRYRDSRIIVCAGQGAWEDEMLSDTLEPRADPRRKQICAGWTSGEAT